MNRKSSLGKMRQRSMSLHQERIPDILNQNKDSDDDEDEAVDEVQADLPACTNYWPIEDKSTLIKRLVACIPEKGRQQRYDVCIKSMDFNAVAFGKYSADECHAMTKELLRKVRKFRTLEELMVDASDISNLKPSRPASAYNLYVSENYQTVKEKYGASNCLKKCAELFGKLSPKEKRVYEEKFEAGQKNYKDALTDYKKKTKVNKVTSSPVLLMFSGHLRQEDPYLSEEMCVFRYQLLSDEERLVWIKKYLKHNSLTNLIKEDRAILARSHKAPTKPRDAYTVFLDAKFEKYAKEPTENLSFSDMRGIWLKKWKTMSAGSKQKYIDIVDAEWITYEEKFQDYLKLLTPGKKKAAENKKLVRHTEPAKKLPKSTEIKVEPQSSQDEELADEIDHKWASPKKSEDNEWEMNPKPNKIVKDIITKKRKNSLLSSTEDEPTDDSSSKTKKRSRMSLNKSLNGTKTKKASVIETSQNSYQNSGSESDEASSVMVKSAISTYLAENKEDSSSSQQSPIKGRTRLQSLKDELPSPIKKTKGSKLQEPKMPPGTELEYYRQFVYTGSANKIKKNFARLDQTTVDEYKDTIEEMKAKYIADLKVYINSLSLTERAAYKKLVQERQK